MPLPQPIIIYLKRGQPSSILTVRRADGSMTWSKLHPGMELHDLAHFVVEESLELEEAFFGLLAEGFAISDFELPKEQRPHRLQTANLPPESIQTEHLINLLMTELQFGSALPDFLAQFESILLQHGLPLMDQLTLEKLNDIRRLISELRSRWSGVSIGEVLELRLE